MPVRRHTFIVQVREPGRVPILENVRTKERVRLDDLGALGGQIDRWLEVQVGAEGDAVIGAPAPAHTPVDAAGAALAADTAGEHAIQLALRAVRDPEALLDGLPAAPPLEGDEPMPQLRRFSSPNGAD